MAESSLSTLTDDFLTCNICLEIYREPKILSCLHSFCRTCLENHLDKSKSKKNLTCPLCREITLLKPDRVEGLKNNFFIQNLIDFSISTSTHIKEKLCSYCSLIEKTNPAIGKCLTCGDFLCSECYNRHTLTTETFDHEIATLAGIQSGRYNEKLRSSQQIPCQEHKKEFLRYFCDTCDVPVCRDCVILGHRRGHDIVEPSKAIEKRRLEIGCLLEGLNGKLEEINERRAILKEEESRVDVTERDMSQLIQDATDRWMEMIRKEGNKAQVLLQACIKKRREYLVTTRSKQDEKLLLLKKSTEFCQKVVRDGLEGEIIFLQQMMRERLSFLETSVQCTDALTPWVPPTIQISKTLDENPLQDLFRFEESCSPTTQSCAKGNTAVKEDHQETYLLRSMPKSLAKSCPNLDKVAKKDTTMTKGNERANGTKEDPKGKQTRIGLIQLHVINCNQDGDTMKPKLTSIDWMNEDSFVVVDEVNGKVKLFNTKGQLLHSVKMKNVLTVACSKTHIYCGLSTGQIKVLNSNLDVLDVSSQKYWYCVPVATGKMKTRVLLMGSSFAHFVTKETEVSKSVHYTNKRGNQMRLKPVFPHCFREENIVVSDWISGCVYVINTDGKIINTFQKESDCWVPGGLACDKENNIYIADYDRNELIVLNSNCQLVTTLKLPKLKNPRCMACSDNNKLLITFNNGVAIFQISKGTT
ncbi:hypothetical protein FSP39_003159 [Pinctada imbricata]|uniref:Uncharacterized protein n=1 Tax=Pinctada imbricata TaxID=66713 RepID=A0AA89BPN8_PINIB|nr:hypothetical protein FSP39_003159 [Pinctada imbricata]